MASSLQASGRSWRIFLISDAQLDLGTTQPILCCIGQSVATSPTQFLMERAIAATQLDWRAITVEVALQDLPAAVAGMTAMKFMAVRFFPWLENSALKQIGHSTELLNFVGGVTSAKRSIDGWQLWHHWGEAVLHWVQQQADLSHTLCWLHGDSVRCRSFLVALQQQAARQASLPSAVLWSQPADAIPSSLYPGQAEEPQLPLQIVSPDGPGEVPLGELLNSAAVKHDASTLLIIGDELPCSQFELSAEISRCLVAGGNAAVESAVECRLPQLTLLGEAEQTVLCEAYDFQRWTGHHIHPAILQDALDEYCDF